MLERICVWDQTRQSTQTSRVKRNQRLDGLEHHVLDEGIYMINLVINHVHTMIIGRNIYADTSGSQLL